MQTAERISAHDLSDNFVFQRSILAYTKASELVYGNVLEIGTGSGYGVSLIAGKADEFITIDKYDNNIHFDDHKNVRFIRMKFPQQNNMTLPSEHFDFVITFQVIEHIKNDKLFLQEIKRVLKPGGKLIITTPNIEMSLTRNPWHIREYTPKQFNALLSGFFKIDEQLGVFGNEKIMDYYQKNKASVERITRLDLFNFQHNLPRQLLQIPYDILNRINRKKLLNKNTGLVQDIRMEDYFIGSVDNNCFDLFFIAQKE